MLNRTKKLSVFDILNSTFLILFSILIIYPFWNLLLISFSDPIETTSLGFHVWIKNWRLDSYRYIFSNSNLSYAYINTILRTAVGTALGLVLTILGAYPLSKKNLPGRNLFTTYILITMFFAGGVVPSYLLIRNLNLVDNFWALILPSMVNVFYIIIMRNYFMTIDKGIEESAFIDGAGYLTILVKIIIPISKPIIATVVLWTAVYYWNEWFSALIYMRDEKKVVLQLVLRRMLELAITESESLEDFSRLENTRIVGATVRAAITIVTIGPIVFMYPFAQKHFIKGIMIGSLKG